MTLTRKLCMSPQASLVMEHKGSITINSSKSDYMLCLQPLLPELADTTSGIYGKYAHIKHLFKFYLAFCLIASSLYPLQ